MPPFRRTATVRVIAGSHRGRIIPFSNRDFGNADITPQKVKGAVFSMIGEWLADDTFLDLFAGSGQIGIEALSRQAAHVVFVEYDAARCGFITSCLDSMGLSQRASVLCKPWEDAVAGLRGEGRRFDYIFVDPPYTKSESGSSYRIILQALCESGILRGTGRIIIQHFHANRMDVAVGNLRLRRTRRFGATSVSIYAE